MGATSWDANVFLCLGAWGLPDDVVKRMMKMTKKIHEEFSLGGARVYWVSNPVCPSLVKIVDPRGHKSIMKFSLPPAQRLSSDRSSSITWQNRIAMTIEFKKEWRLRSIEERKKKVVEWCKFGDEEDQRIHQKRLSKFSGNRRASESRSEWIEKSKELNKVREKYTNNLWRSWEAWSYCENPPQIINWDIVRPQSWAWMRRVHVSRWYEGIHPGRFFLFYRKNKIIEERNRGAPSGPCKDGYVFPKTPIFDWGPYEQLIEDLRCIDGPGLGEKSGKTIDHIDDLFI